MDRIKKNAEKTKFSILSILTSCYFLNSMTSTQKPIFLSCLGGAIKSVTQRTGRLLDFFTLCAL